MPRTLPAALLVLLAAAAPPGPNPPRAADARLQVARVAALQARTQLGRALALPETTDKSDPGAHKGRVAEFTRARALFDSARKELRATAGGLGEQARNKADLEL